MDTAPDLSLALEEHVRTPSFASDTPCEWAQRPLRHPPVGFFAPPTRPTRGIHFPADQATQVRAPRTNEVRLVAGFHTRFGPPSPFSTTSTVYPSPSPVTCFSHSRPWGLLLPAPRSMHRLLAPPEDDPTRPCAGDGHPTTRLPVGDDPTTRRRPDRLRCARRRNARSSSGPPNRLQKRPCAAGRLRDPPLCSASDRDRSEELPRPTTSTASRQCGCVPTPSRGCP
jgi:hypothetical protein